MPHPMIPYLVSLMIAASPPGRVPARETHDDAMSRYESIAADVVHVVADAAPLFGGSHGRQRTAVLMIAVATLESGLRVDVDTGATRGKAGECGLWQIMPASGETCAPWTKDRRLGASIALSRMRRSQRACLKPGVPLELFLAAYAAGRCDRGHVESRARVQLAQRWATQRPTPAWPAAALAGGRAAP